MKPFDVEAALKGAKVVTEDGEEVTQLTRFHGVTGRYALAGVIRGSIRTWTEKGQYGRDGLLDLFMAPVKHQVWLNIYPNSKSTGSHATREDADRIAASSRIACVCIEYEDGEGLDASTDKGE